jgi:hypothetical protein
MEVGLVFFRRVFHEGDDEERETPRLPIPPGPFEVLPEIEAGIQDDIKIADIPLRMEDILP